MMAKDYVDATIESMGVGIDGKRRARLIKAFREDARDFGKRNARGLLVIALEQEQIKIKERGQHACS